MVLLVVRISGYFAGALGAPALLLILLHLGVPETCERREAAGLHGEDADSPGCQHPEPDPSAQRQLPVSTAGPLDHQRRLARLFKVPRAPCNRIQEPRCVDLSWKEQTEGVLLALVTAMLCGARLSFCEAKCKTFGSFENIKT